MSGRNFFNQRYMCLLSLWHQLEWINVCHCLFRRKVLESINSILPMPERLNLDWLNLQLLSPRSVIKPSAWSMSLYKRKLERNCLCFMSRQSTMEHIKSKVRMPYRQFLERKFMHYLHERYDMGSEKFKLHMPAWLEF